MIVTYQHAKELDYCNKGLRAFCASHNLDYQDFKANGIAAEVLLAFDDAMCNDLVAHAAQREKDDQ